MLFILCDLFMEELNYYTASVRNTVFLSTPFMLGVANRKNGGRALKRDSYCAITALSLLL